MYVVLVPIVGLVTGLIAVGVSGGAWTGASARHRIPEPDTSSRPD